MTLRLVVNNEGDTYALTDAELRVLTSSLDLAASFLRLAEMPDYDQAYRLAERLRQA